MRGAESTRNRTSPYAPYLTSPRAKSVEHVAKGPRIHPKSDLLCYWPELELCGFWFASAWFAKDSGHVAGFKGCQKFSLDSGSESRPACGGFTCLRGLILQVHKAYLGTLASNVACMARTLEAYGLPGKHLWSGVPGPSRCFQLRRCHTLHGRGH